MDTQQTQAQVQMVEAPDFSEVIKALQSVIIYSPKSTPMAITIIHKIKNEHTLPTQDVFDQMVEDVFLQFYQEHLPMEHRELIAGLLTVVEDYQQ